MLNLKRFMQSCKNTIGNKYPCSDGGWIHYRVTCQKYYDDIVKRLEVKCSWFKLM